MNDDGRDYKELCCYNNSAVEEFNIVQELY